MAAENKTSSGEAKVAPFRAARPWLLYVPEPLTVLATGSPPKFAPWTSVHTSKGACQLLRKFHQGTVHSGQKNIVLLLTFSKGRKRPCNLTSHLLLQVCVTSHNNGPLPRPPGLRVYLCLLDWRRVRDSIPRDMGCPLGPPPREKKAKWTPRDLASRPRITTSSAQKENDRHSTARG